MKEKQEITQNIEDESVTPLICATTSTRRIKALQHVFEGTFPLIFVNGGDEEPEDPYRVVQQKANHAKREIDGKYQRYRILAADTQSKLPLTDKFGIFDWKLHGKPDEFLSVGKTFEGLWHCAQYDKDTVYSVRSATSLHDSNGNKVISERKMTIQLHPEVIEYLATTQGLEDYLLRFQQVYDSPMYRDNGHTVTPKDMCAGVSFPVLVMMDAVKGVDGKSLTSEMFKQTFYHVAVGIDTDILERISPGAKEKMNSWKWLDTVTEYCIQK